MELLSIGNRHTPESGHPPAWLKEAPQGERSYFENAFGEQWIVEAGDESLRLTGGDVGWETYSIAMPDYRLLAEQLSKPSAGLPFGNAVQTMDSAERTWLRAACLARIKQ